MTDRLPTRKPPGLTVLQGEKSSTAQWMRIPTDMVKDLCWA